MGRTPQELFEEHLAAIAAGDLDAVAAGYREDARLLTTDATVQGRAAIREWMAVTLGAFPGLRVTVGSAVYAEDAVLLTWSAESAGGRITDAVDTLVFDGDGIRLQTTVFHVVPPDTD